MNYVQMPRTDGSFHCANCWHKGPLRVEHGVYMQDEGCGGAACPCHLLAAERERVIDTACNYLRPNWERDEESDGYVTGRVTPGSREKRFREKVAEVIAAPSALPVT